MVMNLPRRHSRVYNMMFRRRTPLRFSHKITGVFWPRCGVIRALKYQGLRLKRLSASPHAVAAGAAAGIFVSCTPFLGFQMMLGAILALVIGGSIVSMAIASWIGNPLTYPLIWATGYHVGTEIMEELPPHITEPLASALENPVTPLLGPTLVGTLVVGILAGVATYVFVMWLIFAWRERRQGIILTSG
jgi:uncharacterized protein (DUF2062 family)